MRPEIVQKITRSILYEGYMLYPYRRSSLKNQHRWNFGLVYPEPVEPCRMITECLLAGSADASVVIDVRFLQLYEQDGWQEAVEREIVHNDVGTYSFRFDQLHGDVCISREQLRPGLQRLRVEIMNRTPVAAGPGHLLQCFVSTHTVLTLEHAEFVSLLDPPDEWLEAATTCRNVGTWPVLVGQSPERDCMLSSPIILYDYPRVADESPGDLFDATEIDEILTLRILALTDSEKEEMRRSGLRERELLERAESLSPEELLKLHGTMRDIRVDLKPGDRVRLHPKPGGDIFDVVLKDRVAIVESVEQDFDNRTHVAVIVEDDPGKDLGLMRQPGHRFFFTADEVELIR
jgi:hypothetical protein